MTRPARARQLGIAPGILPTGRWNSITDVPGVAVGHTTVRHDPDLRTGVTAIVPASLRRHGVLAAGLFVGNGFGKLIGATQLAELGVIETPIVLTGTLSAFRTADALVSYMLALPGNDQMRTVNPIVGETNDGYLSDIRLRPITSAHVLDALANAASGPVEEGAVGAGTGTSALGFKAGIGTSSRVMSRADAHDEVTIGVLVQSNFSGTLTVLGVPIASNEALGDLQSGSHPDTDQGGNSCMIVVATDAALDARQLERLARRALFAMGKVGSDFAHGSGDYAIAFSVEPGPRWPDAALDPLFFAVQEAVEEALLNSLFMAETTTGYQGHVRYSVPHDHVITRLRAHGFLPPNE